MQSRLSSRLVHLHRSSTLGLGLSIKGGAEHELPILISRIVSDGPADVSKQLFIGDQILGVNHNDFDNRTTHDEALTLLRESGNEVTLRVRHHKAANILRKRWRKDDNHLIDLPNDNPLIRKTSSPESSKSRDSDTNVTNHWKECVQMELFFSSVSQYVCDSDKLRDAGFEVKALNGQSVVVQCDNEEICRQWRHTISTTINNLTNNHVSYHLHNRLMTTF